MNFSTTWKSPVFLGFLITALGLIYFAFRQHWDGVGMSLPIDQLVSRLSPLILASAFIERAVEILVSPWRDSGAAKLHRAIDAIQARPANPANPAVTAKNAADLQAANDALDDYKGQTQRYAFAAGLILSLCAAAAGLRALWPFLADSKIFVASVEQNQQAYFRVVDVLITTTLLAGGADGFHGIINAISSYFPSASSSSSSSK
jgi:hypothetical protein